MKRRHELTQEPKIDRRSFLTKLGFLGVGVSGLVAAVGNLMYLKPTVSYGPATVFRVGRPGEFKVGTREVFEKERVVVVRDERGFAAISVVCTHLGCTIRTSDAGFECPCHGSQYDQYGLVTGGPAPRPLDWYRISMAPSGELEIDKNVRVPSLTFLVA